MQRSVSLLEKTRARALATPKARRSPHTLLGAAGAILAVGLLVAGGLLALGPMLVASMLAALVSVGVFFKRPKMALIIWILATCFLPPWAGVSVGFFVTPLTLLGCLVMVMFLGSAGWRPAAADLVIISVIVLGAVGVIFAEGSRSVLFSTIALWFISYLVGKVLTFEAGLRFTSTLIGVTLTLIALFSIVEFVADWHPFAGFYSDNYLYEIWSPIQERGGLSRSEWSFGHSIALGGSLALAVPFVMTSRWNLAWKLASLLTLGAGTAVTFSRSAMIVFVLSLAISLVFLTGTKLLHKFAFAVAALAAAAFALPRIGQVFEEAGSEAFFSAMYRSGLLDLAQYMLPLGHSTFATQTATGGVAFGRYVSIDNTFLWLGLTLGWVIALLLLIPFVFLVVRLITRRSSAAEVALLAQLPLLFTTAPITQWQALIWFVAGVAVSMARFNAAWTNCNTKSSERADVSPVGIPETTLDRKSST